MGNEGRAIIFVLISTGEAVSRGRQFLCASKEGLGGGGQGLLNKFGVLPLKGEKKGEARNVERQA